MLFEANQSSVLLKYYCKELYQIVYSTVQYSGCSLSGCNNNLIVYSKLQYSTGCRCNLLVRAVAISFLCTCPLVSLAVFESFVSAASKRHMRYDSPRPSAKQVLFAASKSSVLLRKRSWMMLSVSLYRSRNKGLNERSGSGSSPCVKSLSSVLMRHVEPNS